MLSRNLKQIVSPFKLQKRTIAAVVPVIPVIDVKMALEAHRDIVKEKARYKYYHIYVCLKLN